MSALTLKNPHAVLAALKSRPEDVSDVRVNPAASHPTWREVAELARANGIRVREQVAATQSQRSGRQQRGGKSQREGIAEATVAPRSDVDLKTLFGDDAQRGLWLALDCLQDPHNVGAIFRSAAFFGVRGIVLTKDRSAPLTSTVYDVATGGMETVPFTVQTNLARALDLAKESDLWVLGTSEHAEQDIAQVDRDRRWLLVIGNEEKGMRRLTKDKCDDVCRLTPQGDVTSLNASVAAGVMIAALTR